MNEEPNEMLLTRRICSPRLLNLPCDQPLERFCAIIGHLEFSTASRHKVIQTHLRMSNIELNRYTLIIDGCASATRGRLEDHRAEMMIKFYGASSAKFTTHECWRPRTPMISCGGRLALKALDCSAYLAKQPLVCSSLEEMRTQFLYCLMGWSCRKSAYIDAMFVRTMTRLEHFNDAHRNVTVETVCFIGHASCMKRLSEGVFRHSYRIQTISNI